jgi:hypothetical protein
MAAWQASGDGTVCAPSPVFQILAQRPSSFRGRLQRVHLHIAHSAGIKCGRSGGGRTDRPLAARFRRGRWASTEHALSLFSPRSVSFICGTHKSLSRPRRDERVALVRPRRVDGGIAGVQCRQRCVRRHIPALDPFRYSRWDRLGPRSAVGRLLRAGPDRKLVAGGARHGHEQQERDGKFERRHDGSPVIQTDCCGDSPDHHRLSQPPR